MQQVMLRNGRNDNAEFQKNKSEYPSEKVQILGAWSRESAGRELLKASDKVTLEDASITRLKYTNPAP